MGRRALQPDHATLTTSSASRLYVFHGVREWRAGRRPRPAFEPANERIFLGRLTLDGKKARQSQQQSGGGWKEVWRQAPAAGDADLAWLSKWVDVKKLVRWGSGERSVEAVAAGPTDPVVSEIADPKPRAPPRGGPWRPRARPPRPGDDDNGVDPLSLFP